MTSIKSRIQEFHKKTGQVLNKNNVSFLSDKKEGSIKDLSNCCLIV